jgi:uncharacterized protein
MKSIFFTAFILLVVFSHQAFFAQLTPTQTTTIPMRDGLFLAADVYVPDNCESCPTVLIQTPYNKNAFRNGLPLGYLQNLQSSPYVWVVVDWRGFYASVSATVAQPNRGEDGYDIIEWITEQEWSDGKIGTWGPSALGVIQYQTAREKHPAHICAVPVVADPQTFYQGYFYGGALEEARLNSLDALGYGLSPIILANPYYNLTWQFAESSTWYPQDIEIPTLQIGGWYDHNIDNMIKWYEATRNQAAANVRNQQYLLVGPWVHGGTGPAYVGSSAQGELNYPDAAFRSDVYARDFLAYYLLNENNDWENTPLISYYETGNSTWKYTNEVTFNSTTSTQLFLTGNQELTISAGTGQDSFVSDPRNPTPTIGGQTLSVDIEQGPFDQFSLESRQDVLIFHSPIIQEDFTVSGRIEARLFIECDRPDADIVVRVIDEYPDGRNMLINDGIKRMRFRNGYTQANESFMTAGEQYEVTVELPFTNYTWKEGHRIKILVSGNSSSRWNVNIQDGGALYTAGDTLNATITVVHDASHPSHLVLPGSNLVLSTPSFEQTWLNIYPNPTASTFTIVNNEAIESIQLFDLAGNFVQSFAPNNSSMYSIEHLSKGLYFLQIKTSKSNHTVRIVKE